MSSGTVVVVGGGITGLSAAWQLVQSGVEHVTLLEADARLGGKIRAEELDGLRVEGGPDAILARVPDGVELCRALGLGDELVAPAARRASVWTGDRLLPLPEDLVLGVPSDLVGLARSRILGPAGLLRAAADLVLPRSSPAGDASVGTVVGRRLGRQVVERLVDPLLGGIHAGDADRLSIEATAPQLAAVAGASRSLLAGLHARRPVTEAGQPAEPVFLAPRRGLGSLVERLAAEVGKGADLRNGVRVFALAPTGDSGGAAYRLDTDAGPVEADGVILAVPAPAAAALLGPACPPAAAELRTIRHASVAVVLLAYPDDAFPRALPGAGVLVTRGSGRLMTACSCGSAKWPHWARPGGVVLRISAGRVDDHRAEGLDDDELVARLTSELHDLLGVAGAPRDHRVVRWPEAFPQYEVGHLARVRHIEEALGRDLPGVAVAGAPYRGIGIPACIAQGRAAGRAAAARLAGREARPASGGREARPASTA